MDFLDTIIDVLLALVIFSALIGVILASLNNALNWSAVNIGGTIVNLSWAPYVIILVIVIGVVYFVYKFFFKKKK